MLLSKYLAEMNIQWI